MEGNKTPSFLDSPPAPAWFMQQEQNERVVMAINRVSTAIWFLCLSVVGVGFLLWSSIVIVGDSIIKVNPFQ